MKKFYLSFLLLTFTFYSVSQQHVVNSGPEIDKDNCREGESIEFCLTHKKMKEVHENIGGQEKSNMDRILLEEALQKVKSGAIEKGVVYTIPVVFHVLHDGGSENISDEQIFDAFDILNIDYRKLNDDANSVVSDFLDIASDSEIEFVLATRAPDGSCFNGITRTRDEMSFDGSNGSVQVDAIVNGNDVFRGDWAGNRYLNIYVLGDVGNAAGYTYRPFGNFGATMDAAIFLKHDYVGSFGTSSVVRSRALTHEVGHWLGLPHTWGTDNNPGNAASCTQDDGVDDTPATIGVTVCNRNSNTCNDLSSNFSSWNYDVVDNVENYMDYSYCSKMFTQGQSDLMRAVLNSSTSGRNNLWRSSNLANTGAGESVSLCAANFSIEESEVCQGVQVQFTDQSFSNITGWEWSFPGGSPSSSNIQNPSVVYDNEGTYSVTLKVYSGNSSLTEVKTNFISVLSDAKTLPFFEGFENHDNLSQNDNWSLNESAGFRTYDIFNGASNSGDKCLRLGNYAENINPSLDELISSSFDLSSLNSSDVVTLSYRYAYRKQESSDYESLFVFASTDCGASWVNRGSLNGDQLSDLTYSNNWIPSPSEWETVHITSLKSPYFVSNLRLKFSFTGGVGNNFYLDDINLYKGSPSNNIVYSVLGVDELSTFNELKLFPNPAQDEVNIRFSSAKNQDVNINIYDISGKSAQKQSIKAIEGSNLVLLNVQDLSEGLYFVNFSTGENSETLQFVVK